MAALTESIIRPHRGNREVFTALPVDAGAVVFAGALLSRAAAEGVARPATDTAGEVVLGMSVDELDNTDGADGDVDENNPVRTVRATDGEYAFPVDGAEPLPGQDALVVDDATVSADATTNSIKCGEFTRPGPFDGWWFVRLDKA